MLLELKRGGRKESGEERERRMLTKTNVLVARGPRRGIWRASLRTAPTADRSSKPTHIKSEYS